MNENAIIYFPVFTRILMVAIIVFLVLTLVPIESVKDKRMIIGNIIGIYALVEIIIAIAQRHKDAFCQCDCDNKIGKELDTAILDSITR